MRVDVSEVKSFKHCKRQWQLSSRNKFHLRPKVTPAAFATGTLFHESLHSLYLNVPLEKVMENVKKEANENDACLLAMIPGYARNVLPGDMERFTVLDIEHKFIIEPVEGLDIQICGSIDMICVENGTNKIYGFEHKTAKNFRDTSFLWMDEQPRIYTVALKQYVEEINERRYSEWQKAGGNPEEEPVAFTLGGIYINEVKKLLRDFKYQRTLCTYPEDDLQNFFDSFFNTCCAIKHAVDENTFATPSPSYFNCSMCDYRGVCETYMYSNISKEEILDEFSEELIEREIDHLDEKVEREAK